MSDWAIKVNDLGKRYRIGERQPYFRFTEALERAVAAPLRRLRGRERGGGGGGGGGGAAVRDEANRLEVHHDAAETFWALRGVSFEVPRGEVLGVIGRNGAGKSTLLKLIARITEPTEGEIRMRGRVASLLEVGTGFHPELTGRENVYLNGTILGMAHREVKAKFDEIVEFSGVETFLDTPVKRYSSGMRVRLAFAVAAHLEPEILLIDEVLAVGDHAFQQKCIGKMDDVARSGRTVLFVSHNMSAVQRLCRRAMLLDRGGVAVDGEIEGVVDAYLADEQRSASWRLDEAPPPGPACVREMELRNAEGRPAAAIRAGEPWSLRLVVEVKHPMQRFVIGAGLRRQGVPVRLMWTEPRAIEPGTWIAELHEREVWFSPGFYSFNVSVNNADDAAHRLVDRIGFTIEPATADSGGALLPQPEKQAKGVVLNPMELTLAPA